MLEAQFRIQFPEFNGVSSPLVQSMLDAALLEIDVNIWGKKADQGQAYLAAHKLATSPFGQNAKLSKADGTSTYEHQYIKLIRQISSGFRVC